MRKMRKIIWKKKMNFIPEHCIKLLCLSKFVYIYIYIKYSVKIDQVYKINSFMKFVDSKYLF